MCLSSWLNKNICKGDKEVRELILNDEWIDVNLDYASECNFSSFFSSEGNIHTYPAKAVPEMANSLLLKLKGMYNIKKVLDPFVGSGTIALEAKYLGLDFYGSDLNPLAVLLSQTKVMTINNTMYVKKRIQQFAEELKQAFAEKIPVVVEKFDGINYWFKDENIRQLSFIKHQIDKFLKQSTKYKKEYALIMLTAFSSTIRSSSLSRNGEFKLYRMAVNDIEKFNINSIEEFIQKTKDLLDMLVFVNDSYTKDASSEIYLENAKELSYMKDKKADVIITSPPYGDSSSTVAYGEFSKLSLQWMSNLLYKYLDIESKYDNCDEYLLGGKYSVINSANLHHYKDITSSETLAKLFSDIEIHIENEILDLRKLKNNLLYLQKDITENNIFDYGLFESDSMMTTLIKNHIRMYYFKKIKENKEIPEKTAKKLAKERLDQFVKNIRNSNDEEKDELVKLLIIAISKASKSVTKKINFLPKRENEIKKFFIDLYQVIQQIENVITDEGIQVWIVGHRTVLGSIEIKLAEILYEWFSNIGYKKLALIKRNYHYKRLPHHINSTLMRNQEVKTMNEEHILIVKKQLAK